MGLSNPNQPVINESEWSTAPLLRNPPVRVIVEPLHTPLPWVDATAEEALNTMPKVTIRMKKDLAVSPDGITVHAAKAGEELDVDHLTAQTLIFEDNADHVRGPITLRQRSENGTATANEMNPGYGEGPHRDAVESNQYAEKQEEVLRGQTQNRNKGK